jgi:hypothetical protein
MLTIVHAPRGGKSQAFRRVKPLASAARRSPP